MRDQYLFLLLLVLCFSQCLRAQKSGSYRNWVVASEKQERIALVLGNDDYPGSNKLSEPIKDAEIIAAALHHHAYNVLVGYNLNKTQLELLLIEFATLFQEYEEGIIYYAGHGFQVNGSNFLIPIDASPKAAREIDFYCVDLNRILRLLDQSEKKKMIILDACRNHQFLGNSSTFTSEEEQGLRQIRTVKNSLAVFSTSPNTFVKDDNPFTEILADNILAGGCIYDILANTSRSVSTLDPTQIVWYEGNTEEPFCFVKPTKDQSEVAPNDDTFTPDIDGDGIPDVEDGCPTMPGTKENNGCPVFPAFKWRKVTKDTQRSLISCSLDTMPEVFRETLQISLLAMSEYPNQFYIDSENAISTNPQATFNTFTPNRDGINDVFYFQLYYPYVEIRNLKIYSFQAQVIYSIPKITLEDKELGWDGYTSSGELAPDGTYFYSYTTINTQGQEFMISGDITLIR